MKNGTKIRQQSNKTKGQKKESKIKPFLEGGLGRTERGSIIVSNKKKCN